MVLDAGQPSKGSAQPRDRFVFCYGHFPLYHNDVFMVLIFSQASIHPYSRPFQAQTRTS